MTGFDASPSRRDTPPSTPGTPALEQDDPTAAVLLDRRGEPVFHTVLAADGTVEISAIDPTGETRPLRRLGGAEHPMGVYPQQVTADGKGLLVGSYQDGDDLRLVRVDFARYLGGRSADRSEPPSTD
ncbi:hypothetical protein ACIBEK_07680 [Nocardia fusca]|uniref:hypothetical protein n=1 Tax=Nocardia fusca TaxID=941183 RepID=UPI00379D6185